MGSNSLSGITFSTTEAAAILDMAAETFRTQLKHGWLPVADPAPGRWRRITPVDILRARLAICLSTRGVSFPKGRRVIDALLPDFFGGAVFLYVAINDDGSVCAYNQCGVPDIGVRLATWRVAHFVVIDLNIERNWVRYRIEWFNQRGRAADEQGLLLHDQEKL